MFFFFSRRESPWKVHGDSTVSSKLKLLEEELINLEKVGKGDLSKVSSLMRKQAKRYQSLTGKIDDLCRRMVSNFLMLGLLFMYCFVIIHYRIISNLSKLTLHALTMIVALCIFLICIQS